MISLNDVVVILQIKGHPAFGGELIKLGPFTRREALEGLKLTGWPPVYRANLCAGIRVRWELEDGHWIFQMRLIRQAYRNPPATQKEMERFAQSSAARQALDDMEWNEASLAAPP